MEKNYTYTETGQPLTLTVTTSPWAIAIPVVPLDPTPLSASGSTSDIGTVLPEPTAKISRRYDRLGRVSRICLGDHATVDYEYDVHGWLTSQTLTCADTVMTMTLVYAGSSKPRYNGFISRKDWNGRSYLYEYDGKGRLTKADYTASVNAAEGEDFSTTYSYDSRGNITTLKRKGITDRTGGMESFGTADNMYMDYNGNRMSRVEHILDTPLWPPFVGNLQDEPISVEVDDGGGSISITLPEDFSYNDAGDLTRDETRKIASIRRTTEGRPSEVRFTDGHIQRTVWDMAGNKLSTEYLVEADAIALGEGLSPAEPDLTATEGGISGIGTTGIAPIDPVTPVIHLYTREYTGDGHVIKAKESYTWTGTDTTRVIESIQFDGGYFDSGSGANYYVRDYLGNIIAVVDEWGHLVQATDYYPYGLPFRMEDMEDTESSSSSNTSTSNRYLFGGKEFLTEDGLNEYYQQARQYIPRIPRFDRMDDLSEKWYEYTPYLPFAGNPIMCVDPDGNWAFLVPIVKGLVCGAIDFVTQMSVYMANDKTFSEAFNNVDWTSVVTSAALGATLSPGVSTNKMGATGAAIFLDAAVDIQTNGDIQSVAGVVGKEKPLSDVATDLATDILPSVVCKAATRGFTNAVNSNSVVNLTEETKGELKQVTNIINSDGFQITTGVVIKYETKIGVDKPKNGIKTQAHSSKNSKKKNLPFPKNIPQTDVTKVKVPELIQDFLQKFDTK